MDATANAAQLTCAPATCILTHNQTAATPCWVTVSIDGGVIVEKTELSTTIEVVIGMVFIAVLLLAVGLSLLPPPSESA